jgi:hypothetical protein
MIPFSSPHVTDDHFDDLSDFDRIAALPRRQLAPSGPVLRQYSHQQTYPLLLGDMVGPSPVVPGPVNEFSVACGSSPDETRGTSKYPVTRPCRSKLAPLSS